MEMTISSIDFDVLPDGHKREVILFFLHGPTLRMSDETACALAHQLQRAAQVAAEKPNG